MIDCCSRRLAGWAIADHMRTSLVEDALKAAARDPRQPGAGRSSTPTTESQYTSKDYAKLCDAPRASPSRMGAVGTSADNALAESFNATLKREILQERRPAGPTRPPAAERSSDGSPATTPDGATPTAATLSPNAYENQLAATLPEAA